MENFSAKHLVNDSLFKDLVRKRRATRIFMVSLMATVFLGTQVIWAFFPDLVNTRFPAGGPVSLAVWFTVAVVVFGIALSGIYAMVLGKRLDKLCQSVLEQSAARER